MNLRRDVETENLLPNDIIIVTPFVTHNPLMDELQARIHEFWHQKLKTLNTHKNLKSSRVPFMIWNHYRGCVYYTGVKWVNQLTQPNPKMRPG